MLRIKDQEARAKGKHNSLGDSDVDWPTDSTDQQAVSCIHFQVSGQKTGLWLSVEELTLHV